MGYHLLTMLRVNEFKNKEEANQGDSYDDQEHNCNDLILF